MYRACFCTKKLVYCSKRVRKKSVFVLCAFVPVIADHILFILFALQVALNGWLNLNFTSVAAMFEDRFDLWTLQRRPIASVDKKQVKDTSPGNGEKEIKRAGLRLTRLQLPARRSDELKALTGW